MPQDGRIKLKLSKPKPLISVSTLYRPYLGKISTSYFDPSSAMLGIEALGYEDDQKALFMEALGKASRNATDYRSNRFW